VMGDFYKQNGIRMPVDLPEAERIAQEMSTSLGLHLRLPTKEEVDSIHAAADLKMAMPTLAAGPSMTTLDAFRTHDELIEDRIQESYNLISGHKKEIIKPERTGRVTIYGGMKPDGSFWQSRPSSVHHEAYKDYSHGLRLVYEPSGENGYMSTNNKAILSAAGAYLGTDEWPGAKSNPAVDAMFDDVGHGWADDSTPWCAAFVGSVLASLGLPHTGKLTARSYENYGTGVTIQNAQPGDIVVFWRGTPDSWQGHVAFLVRFEGNSVIVRGGNQGNSVSDAAYPIDRIVAIRRADGVEAEGRRPILRNGDRGAFVLDAQQQLQSLGYTLGKLDGVFGSRTLGAVVAFQADNGLEADGVIGPNTWKALAAADQRELRKVEMSDLEERSRTVNQSSKGQQVATVGGAIATAGVAISEAQNVVGTAQQAEGILEQVGSIAPSALAIIGICVVAYFAYQHFAKIKKIRLDDARTGANDRI